MDGGGGNFCTNKFSELASGSGDEGSACVSDDIASVAETNVLSAYEDLVCLDGPIVSVFHVCVVDFSGEEAFIDAAEDHLGSVGAFLSVEIEGEHVFVESLLLHDVVEHRVQVIGCHFWEGKTDNTIEFRLVLIKF